MWSQNSSIHSIQSNLNQSLQKDQSNLKIPIETKNDIMTKSINNNTIEPYSPGKRRALVDRIQEVNTIQSMKKFEIIESKIPIKKDFPRTPSPVHSIQQLRQRHERKVEEIMASGDPDAPIRVAMMKDQMEMEICRRVSQGQLEVDDLPSIPPSITSIQEKSLKNSSNPTHTFSLINSTQKKNSQNDRDVTHKSSSESSNDILSQAIGEEKKLFKHNEKDISQSKKVVDHSKEDILSKTMRQMNLNSSLVIQK